MYITLSLHPAGHECAPGVVGCSFGPSFFGHDSDAGEDVTLAVGTISDVPGVVLMLDGHVDEVTFRRPATSYRIALLNRGPRCFHRKVFGKKIVYPYTVDGKESPFLRFGDVVAEGDLPKINVRDTVHA